MTDDDGIVEFSPRVRTSGGESSVGDAGVGAVTGMEPERVGGAVDRRGADGMLDQRRLRRLSVEIDDAVNVGGNVERRLTLVHAVDEKVQSSVSFPHHAHPVVWKKGRTNPALKGGLLDMLAKISSILVVKDHRDYRDNLLSLSRSKF